MSLDLRELYQEVIIDHNRNPRNHYEMLDATTYANGFNPLCGDKLTLFLKIEHDRVIESSFKGCGCAISQASASLMTDSIKGQSIAEVRKLFDAFYTMMTQETDLPAKTLDKLTVLMGVKAYPARVKCATLAWHTLDAALNKSIKTITTE
ncbi:MAG: SUF system NifU family Fe-S cluster assembly protein [Legionellaceae bacterium]|nr:SUF system NifU family Fe-S cluster assembly protein [Legionellaceae bacterium]HAF87896.1 SUF system NifU family Fe-S cluster assembly protein [Legionellales bacterium]HCA89331.1 SUF system NifU family Fe-S cluster assembly protein [Legionellales bacterium]|tara:strand:- start:733 stop:1182 length:450 start_codon:yes stop_codon:yes gene_type:complete